MEIKKVCCKFFEKYDKQLDTVSAQNKLVMQKYEDWSKVLIEPQSLNEARLYALETRIHEEEELRLNEFFLVKEQISKLCFTLDQQGIKLQLPKLNPKPMKTLYDERLDHIKTSLDSYKGVEL